VTLLLAAGYTEATLGQARLYLGGDALLGPYPCPCAKQDRPVRPASITGGTGKVKVGEHIFVVFMKFVIRWFKTQVC